NWNVLRVPCGTNRNVRIANTTNARNLNLATVPAVSLGNLTLDVAGAVSLPGMNNCLSNTVTVNGVLTLTRGIITTCNPITSTTAIYVASSSPGAISGASGASFINGRLRRAIQPSTAGVNYLYPLGRGPSSSDYVPAQARFSNTGMLTELMGYYNVTPDPAMTDDTGDLCGSIPPFGNLMTGFWRFESVPATATPTYTMRVWPGVTYTPNQTMLAKRPDGSSPWKAYGCCVPPYNASYIDRGCLTGFSDFKPQTTTTPLPAEGWTFEAQKIARGVQLFWQTTRESGVQRYEVERFDGLNDFATLATLHAAGFSDRANEYVFVDEHPLRGENRYRIRAVDFDGAVSFSEVRSAVWSENPTITVYPNPARDRIRVHGDAPILRLRILDPTGKTCLEVKGEEANIACLSEGAYILEAHTELAVYRRMIFKR
ncbi:MAG: hypothetical protein RMM53_03725, partial [Bacteroidia bacterium]|nr:hypothetical protein [Bacteroidia bacterium]MDW8333305.1 hypothetical protein [Bacteroidia bacterium]